MGPIWLDFWEICLTLALFLSTCFTIFIVTLPTQYRSSQPHQVKDSSFSEDDRKNADESGYTVHARHQDESGILTCDTSIQVVVLGDIGRSPRMQYHAMSLAQHGSRVFLIGYVESEVHPHVTANRLITVIPIAPTPKTLQTSGRLLFLLLAPIKVLWQIWSLYRALAYRTPACKYILVQNPPSIPTLAVAQLTAIFRNSRLVIDWHNFGYSILAMRLGDTHPLVKISRWYEGFFSKAAHAHFCVTNAMSRVLKRKWNIDALPLHDRPPVHFQPLTSVQRGQALSRIPATSSFAQEILKGNARLIVSSTSWTADEDFTLLLDALVAYSAFLTQSPQHKLPRLLAVITGKGPQKQFYLDKIATLQNTNRLPNVQITTAWLSAADYAALLGSADLGISLHTSSSGVDLPMKVVDMFGTGLPVAGWSDFEAWPELVTEGVDGRGFRSAEELKQILTRVFAGSGQELAVLRQGAMKAGERRWEEEWMPVAGKLFQVRQ